MTTGNFTQNTTARTDTENATRGAEDGLRKTSRHWSTDETEAFAALYRDGKSLKDCCIIFGRTEQAAIKHMQQAGIVRTVNVPRPRRGGIPRVAPIGPLPTELATLPNEPAPAGVDSGCLWLIGEPRDRLFCGAAREHGSAYCACHHVRAYTNAGANNTNEGAAANG